MTMMSDAMRRDRAVEEAVAAADRVLRAAATSDVEMDYLTCSIAAAFIEKTKIPLGMRLLRREFTDEH